MNREPRDRPSAEVEEPVDRQVLAPRFDPSRFLRAADALGPVVERGADVKGRALAIGGTLVCLGRVGSTQEQAKRLALRGAPDGTIVLAEEQISGRGRRGRSWGSPSGGGIWATIILRGPFEPVGPHWLTLAGAVAVCEAARSLGAAAAEIKWPNDVTSRERKFAGVLGEVASSGGVPWVLLGIGIDLSLRPGDLPPDIAVEVTSLRAEGIRPDAGREEILASMAARLDLWCAAIRAGDTLRLLERLVALSPSASGRHAVVEEPDGGTALRGTTRGLGADASLIIEEEGSGLLRHVRFGGTLRLTVDPRRARS